MLMREGKKDGGWLTATLKAAVQLINNPLGHVGLLSGTIAPTTVAAALSVASFGGASAVTSSKRALSSAFLNFFV